MPRRFALYRAVAVALVMWPSAARADEPGAIAPHPPCADDVAGAPRPGEESGRVDDGDGGDSTLREIGRGALFVPKIAIDAALQPVRAGLWAWDRFRLQELYYRVFFNDARTIGITPSFGYDYGYGVDGVYGGIRFVDRDVFGAREHLAITAATGMRFRQVYTLDFTTGDRFGDRFRLGLSAGFEQRPEDPFYGIGNGDLAAMPGAPIDPRVDNTALFARYRVQRERLALVADTRVWRSLHVRPSAGLGNVTFGNSDVGAPIMDAYDPRGLVGWNGVRFAYGELDVRWDGRDRTTAYEPKAVFATGTLLDAFGGREHRLDGGADFWRYGGDAQHFFRLGEGPRVLSFRLHGEAVSGSRAEVPFAELPMLGGLTYLRGYPFDRFRDRVVAFGSAQYAWDLAARVQANLFVDAGRAYGSLDELSVDHLRVGYGLGIEIHTESSFLFETSIASSIDGGVMFNLGFNPVFAVGDHLRNL